MTNPQQLVSKLCHCTLFRCRRIRASLSRHSLGWNYCNIAASLPPLRASLTSCLRDGCRRSIFQKAFSGTEGLIYQTFAQTLPHYSLFAGDAGVLIYPEGLAHQARATGAARLRQAILQKAFSGGLIGHDTSSPCEDHDG